MKKAKPFSVNQKFCVYVSDSISFTTTKKQIIAGVGFNINFNDAVRFIFEEYESCNVNDENVLGFSSSNRGFSIQLNLL